MKKTVILAILVVLFIRIFWIFLPPEAYGDFTIGSDSAVDRYIEMNKDAAVTFFGPTVSGPKNVVSVQEGAEVIGSYVEKTKAFQEFLLVKRKPLDEVCECNSACLDTLNLPDKRTYRICREALKKYTHYDYSIIDTNKNIIYGPFEKDAFLSKGKELKIPESSLTL